MIKLKRVYEEEDTGDGVRYLVDRLWPRGIKKTSLRIDGWLKGAGPSSELRKWFSHVPERFEEFRSRCRRELRGKRQLIDELRERAADGRLTIVYAARDREHNNAVVLAELLRKG